MKAVEISGLAVSFGSATILKSVDVSLEAGTVLALLGPSGCGKTTLLKAVAGLLEPMRGTISIFDETVVDCAERKFVPAERRGLGMVFQDYALWPHLSIGGNVGFPLEMLGVGRAERATRVAAALHRVGLGGFERRSPSSLSGGQQQRVAIARAIVAEPRLVLFDEPLSNLDRELRATLVGEIADLVRSLGVTAIYVTHDQSEAFGLADQVAVMRDGGIAQLSAPEILVDQPATRGVAEILDLGPLVAAERRAEGWWAEAIGTFVAGPDDGPVAGTRAEILLARRALRFAKTGESGISGTVTRTQFSGDNFVMTVHIGAAASGLDVRLESDCRMNPGEPVCIGVDSGRLRWFVS